MSTVTLSTVTLAVREHALPVPEPLHEQARRHGYSSFDAEVKAFVGDAAAILDEHVPGWHMRITRTLDMEDVHNCVLGQVFRMEGDGQVLPRRRLFGLLRSRFASRDRHGCGYGRGSAFLEARGIYKPPFAFSCSEAGPYWKAEIEKRRAA